jgi:tetratricopeptide (TPR) repeat protein
LTLAGREKEGRALMETADWALLGNAEGRYKLARELSRRGLAEAARRERKLAFHLGWSEPRLPLVWGRQGSWVDDALRLDTADALSPHELRQAAARCERLLLATIGEGNCLPRPASFYLSGPHQVHFLRARAFAAEGRIQEALEEVQLCLAFLPGDVEMPVCLVPELEKQGHKKEADELFGRVFRFYERLCKDYPRWAEGHNSLAWLAARCGRRLEEALEHSRRAVQLAPRNAAYLATLAEVHFRRGERAKALELIKQCVELAPKNEAFRKRLQRWEAGGPAGTVP